MADSHGTPCGYLTCMRALILTASLFLVACSAQRVLFQPTAEQQALLSQPPLDLSVVVVHWPARARQGMNAGAYASQLADLLRGTRAFRSVVYDSTGAAAATSRS